MKIQLWGLPASGTTIIVRYFHSLPDSFFMTEPLHRLWLKKIDPEIGIENEFSAIQASLKGFKECVHTPDAQWFNTFRKKEDWTTIGMIRNPIGNWGSMLGFGWGTKEKPVEAYLSFAIPFMKAIKEYPCIVYEKFCETPSEEVERTTGIKSPKNMILKKMTHRLGNPTAHQSASVEVIPAVSISDADRSVIEKSGIMDLYGELAAQANQGLVSKSR